MEKFKSYLTIIFMCCLLYVMSYFHRVSPTVIAMDIMEDFKISENSLGLFSSATMMAYGLMQLPSGMLSDLFGGRKTLVLLTVAAGGGALWFAFSGSAQSAVAARFLVGLGLAVTVPAATLLASWSSPQAFVRSTSIVFASGGLGGILAAPPLAFLSNHVGWRTAIAGFALFTLLLAVLTLWLIKDSPEGRNSPAPRRPDLGKLLEGVKNVGKSRRFWMLCIWYMCTVGGNFCMTSLWWGPYLSQACGLTKLEVSHVLTANAVGLMLCYPLMGWMSDVVFKCRKPLMLACSVTAAACLAALVAGKSSLGLWGIMVLVPLFGVCTSSPGALAFAMLKDVFPASQTGTALGLINMSFPIWAGVLQFGYGMAFSTVSGSLGVGAGHLAGMALLIVNLVAGLFFLLPVPEHSRPAAEVPALSDR